MKIERSNFHMYRNHDHFQCQKELIELWQQFDPQALKIEALVEKHNIVFKKEDEALMKIIKNTFSQARNDADVERDRSFRGLDDTTKAALNHYDIEMRNNAIRIRIPMEAYGNIAQKNLNEETSAIYNLVQELRNNFADDVDRLNLHPWLDVLEATNMRYEELVKSSYEEEVVKTELKVKEVRAEVDVVVRQIFDRIEALMIVEGDADYVDLVKRINLIMEKYNLTLAQRQGVNAAKKKEDEGTDTDDNGTDEEYPDKEE